MPRGIAVPRHSEGLHVIMKIKICGLTRPEDVLAANTLNIDYAGFIFWPRSRRCVSPGEALGLRKQLSKRIRAVGVFVDEEPDTILAIARSGAIDAIQLHGSEDADYVVSLKQRTNLPIIQAFRLRKPEDAGRAEASPADLVLLDAGRGEGRTFDWSLARLVRRDYFLAGGLSPDNVSEAVGALRPWGLDVSSGVETDGKKDPEKMAAFVAAAMSTPSERRENL